ncbi:MAG: V-type ATP synthase subunit D [Mucilaginibacter sp.]|nr:MAG: V-type ATP synthase subunit D [Mucilaginibacter sp.]HEK19023.1 V-type ATP synthase subunit D [Bacteroidota bacterium]
MAIKFQYNKISLQDMQKQLKVRLDALPVIRYKEMVLHAEAEKAKREMTALETTLLNKISQYEYMNRLWQEFPQDVMSVKEIKTSLKNIAGVKVPQFEDVVFEMKPLVLFNQPFWVSDGIALLWDLLRLSIEKQLLVIKTESLNTARKKTTQKVNLYEKVQVPGYLSAISKIKKFMNDEESLGKATQKIMKKRILSI